MQTQQQQERLSFIDRVLHLDPTTYIYGGVIANADMAYQHIEADYTRTDYLKWDIQNVHNKILNLVAQRGLIQNPRYVDVFVTVLNDPQFARKSGLAANEAMIFQELVNRDLPCTAENVSQTIVDLWDQLADNSQYRENKADSDRRHAQIAEMTGSGTHGFSIQRGPRKFAYEKDGRTHDPNRGMAQGSSMALRGAWSPSQGKAFAEMSNEQVNALYQEWKVSNNLRNMSIEDLRKLVRSNGTTDVFGKNVRVPSVVAPGPDVLLENPATPGQEFKQRDLIRYINAAPYNGRNLITRNGRVVPELRKRFEEIIRGERG